MAYGIKGDLSVLRRIFSRFIRVESLSGNTGNVLSADNNGEIVSRNVDFFLTGSTIFNNKVNNSTFYPYTSATNTLIGTKLDKSAFTGFTDSFYTYTSATNTLIGTKLDTSIFANYTANTGSNVSSEFTAFTQTFYQYTADTNNLINTKLDKTTFTAFTNSFNSYSSNTLNTINTKLDTSVFTSFTNSFYSYSSNTQNTINNNYSQFTGFTNSFNSYSANTQNTINNNYSQFTSFTNSFYSYSSNTLNTINNNYNQFTAFTNSFNGYSANTQTQLNNKYDKSGGTISGNVTINGNLIVNGTATTINTQNLLVYDPIIGLALVQSGSTNPTLDSGFIIERGLSGNTGFIWKEANKQFELGYTNNTYNDLNVNISNYGNLKLGGLKTNYIYDSLGLTGLTNYILSTTPTGIKWLSATTIDISGKLDFSVFTAFTNSFYSYSSNTLNTINNNYRQFTAFTNSFNSYSANTQNTINSNYRQFTAFTNTFYVYSAQTDSRLLFSSGTIGSTFRINNNNEASGQYSTVSGGYCNTTSGSYSSVSGGRFNTLSGLYSFIGGGSLNIASGQNSVISGGKNNTSRREYSTISGGYSNDIELCDSSIGGGIGNFIINGCSTIAGGVMNVIGQGSTFSGYWNGSFITIPDDVSACFTVGDDLRVFDSLINKVCCSTVSNSYYNPGTTCTEISLNTPIGSTGTFPLYNKTKTSTLGNYNFIGGGSGNVSYGNYSNVNGGCRNTASGYYSFIGAGFLNTVIGSQSVIGGGNSNISSGNSSFLGGGELNIASGQNSVIGGGRQNTSSGNYSTISGGYLNITLCSQSFIGGGRQNTSSGYRSIIGGGGVNIASGQDSFVGAGYGNEASGDYSFIGGGFYNTASGTNTFVLGSNITGSLNNTTYVENLNVKNNIYDSFGTTGTTGYLLSTTPTGVKWVSGATSSSLTPNFDYIDFTTGYTATSKTARVYYDSNEQALSYFPNTPSMDVTVNIGQESLIRVYNNTGVQINNGSVVHISGSSLGLPTIVLSNAAFDDRAEVSGVATHNIPNNTIGFITNFGVVRDVNTSAFNVGDELYLSDTISGGFTNNVIGINFSSRVCSVGWVITSGTTNGKILVSITNENKVQSLTNKQVNILLGNTISTGVFEFTGLTKTSNTTFQIAPVRGWFVDNTTNPVIPYVLQVNYSGSTTGQTTPYLSTSDATYILLTSASTITFQTTFPTPQERRLNIFLGKVIHPSRTSILNINNTVDFDVSPMSALRDLWTPIKLINDGIIVSPNGANLNINTSAGGLWGNGIGWTTNQLNPNQVSIAAKSPASFFYRTQTGGTSSSVTLIDPTKYDVGGAITSMGAAGSDNASNQRVYLYPTGVINILYGQTNYTNLTAAVAGIQTETFVTYPNAQTTGVLIGIISVRNDIVADGQPLTNTNYAKFTSVSKFGELLGGTGGLSTTTLQQAYDNSVQPEILTNSTLGAVTFKRGSTSESDNVIEVQNSTGTNTFAVTGEGNVSGNSFNVKTYIYDSLNTSGVTNQVLFTTPSGVRWNNIDSIVTGLTNNKVIESGSGILSTVRINANNITSGNYSGVLSGTGNTASGLYSFVGGGRLNIVTGSTSFIGGGCRNTVSNTLSTISGGYCNTLRGFSSFVGGGSNNLASGNYSTISGGYCNTISGARTFIGGGFKNTSSGDYSVIGGGLFNNVTPATSYSGIFSGSGNTTNGIYTFIGGGCGNTTIAGSDYSVVAGGLFNTATGNQGFIGGGILNRVISCAGTVAGGCRNTSSAYGGSIGGGFSNLTCGGGPYSSIAGGASNTTSSWYSVIAGGGINSVSGTYCGIVARGNAIVGGRLNTIITSVSGVTGINYVGYSSIGGGLCNSNFGTFSTISGGYLNRSCALGSSISGGRQNTSSGNYSFVGGGRNNTVIGLFSNILGGTGNTVTSVSSFGNILGGRNNTTACNNSFILGSNITANAIDTTFTQCINACGQTLLQGTSASSGCALLVRNSTPLALYTALNTGQHLFNGTFTSTANATCGWNLNQTLTQRGTGCDTLYATYINPTIIYTQNNQTNKALSVQALFTGTTLTWTGATNIIADFGATNIGTQLTVSDVISGTIYGVNDVSGLPIIDATSNWDVNMYDFPNRVFTKTNKSLILGVSGNSASTVTIQSDLIFNENIGLGYRMSQVTGLTTGSSVSVLYQLTIPTGQTVFLTTNTLGRANNANMDSTLGEIKFTAKRSLTGSLTQVGTVQGFVNRDNNNTNVGIDISSNNIRLVVTGNTDTYLWASNIITQTY